MTSIEEEDILGCHVRRIATLAGNMTNAISETLKSLKVARNSFQHLYFDGSL